MFRRRPQTHHPQSQPQSSSSSSHASSSQPPSSSKSKGISSSNVSANVASGVGLSGKSSPTKLSSSPTMSSSPGKLSSSPTKISPLSSSAPSARTNIHQQGHSYSYSGSYASPSKASGAATAYPGMQKQTQAQSQQHSAVSTHGRQPQINGTGQYPYPSSHQVPPHAQAHSYYQYPNSTSQHYVQTQSSYLPSMYSHQHQQQQYATQSHPQSQYRSYTMPENQSQTNPQPRSYTFQPSQHDHPPSLRPRSVSPGPSSQGRLSTGYQYQNNHSYASSQSYSPPKPHLQSHSSGQYPSAQQTQSAFRSVTPQPPRSQTLLHVNNSASSSNTNPTAGTAAYNSSGSGSNPSFGPATSSSSTGPHSSSQTQISQPRQQPPSRPVQGHLFGPPTPIPQTSQPYSQTQAQTQGGQTTQTPPQSRVQEPYSRIQEQIQKFQAHGQQGRAGYHAHTQSLPQPATQHPGQQLTQAQQHRGSSPQPVQSEGQYSSPQVQSQQQSYRHSQSHPSSLPLSQRGPSPQPPHRAHTHVAHHAPMTNFAQSPQSHQSQGGYRQNPNPEISHSSVHPQGQQFTLPQQQQGGYSQSQPQPQHTHHGVQPPQQQQQQGGYSQSQPQSQHAHHGVQLPQQPQHPGYSQSQHPHQPNRSSYLPSSQQNLHLHQPQPAVPPQRLPSLSPSPAPNVPATSAAPYAGGVSNAGYEYHNQPQRSPSQIQGHGFRAVSPAPPPPSIQSQDQFSGQEQGRGLGFRAVSPLPSSSGAPVSQGHGFRAASPSPALIGGAGGHYGQPGSYHTSPSHSHSHSPSPSPTPGYGYGLSHSPSPMMRAPSRGPDGTGYNNTHHVSAPNSGFGQSQPQPQPQPQSQSQTSHFHFGHPVHPGVAPTPGVPQQQYHPPFPAREYPPFGKTPFPGQVVQPPKNSFISAVSPHPPPSLPLSAASHAQPTGSVNSNVNSIILLNTYGSPHAQSSPQAQPSSHSSSDGAPAYNNNNGSPGKRPLPMPPSGGGGGGSPNQRGPMPRRSQTLPPNGSFPNLESSANVQSSGMFPTREEIQGVVADTHIDVGASADTNVNVAQTPSGSSETQVRSSPGHVSSRPSSPSRSPRTLPLSPSTTAAPRVDETVRLIKENAPFKLPPRRGTVVLGNVGSLIGKFESSGPNSTNGDAKCVKSDTEILVSAHANRTPSKPVASPSLPSTTMPGVEVQAQSAPQSDSPPLQQHQPTPTPIPQQALTFVAPPSPPPSPHPNQTSKGNSHLRSGAAPGWRKPAAVIGTNEKEVLEKEKQKAQQKPNGLGDDKHVLSIIGAAVDAAMGIAGAVEAAASPSNSSRSPSIAILPNSSPVVELASVSPSPAMKPGSIVPSPSIMSVCSPVPSVKAVSPSLAAVSPGVNPGSISPMSLKEELPAIPIPIPTPGLGKGGESDAAVSIITALPSRSPSIPLISIPPQQPVLANYVQTQDTQEPILHHGESQPQPQPSCGTDSPIRFKAHSPPQAPSPEVRVQTPTRPRSQSPIKATKNVVHSPASGPSVSSPQDTRSSASNNGQSMTFKLAAMSIPGNEKQQQRRQPQPQPQVHHRHHHQSVPAASNHIINEFGAIKTPHQMQMGKHGAHGRTGSLEDSPPVSKIRGAVRDNGSRGSPRYPIGGDGTSHIAANALRGRGQGMPTVNSGATTPQRIGTGFRPVQNASRATLPSVPVINLPADEEDEDTDEDDDDDDDDEEEEDNDEYEDGTGAPSITISHAPAITVSTAPSITYTSAPTINVTSSENAFSAPPIVIEGAEDIPSVGVPSIILDDLAGNMNSSYNQVAPPPKPHKRGFRALGVKGGLKCYGCGKGIVGRIVSAMGGRWHPECFRCCVCGEHLEHISSYEHEGQAYCHLDYHEKFAPQCYHCRTPIIDEQFITLDDPALGKRTYHELHFFCAECGDPFIPPSRKTKGVDDRIHPSEIDVGFTVYQGHPYCEACHIRLRYPKCKKCKKSVHDGQGVEALGGIWCIECFVCAGCLRPFENPSFFQRGNKPFCESCFSLILKNEL